MKKQLLLTLGLAPLAILQTGEAWAFPTILDAWRAKYPASTSSDIEDTNGCQLCHLNANGGQPWNEYGWAIRTGYLPEQTDESLLAAFMDAEAINSDGDPTLATNLTEIQENTQPGWTPGNVNTIYSYEVIDGVEVVTPVPLQPPPIELAAIAQDPYEDSFLNTAPGSVDFSEVKKGRSSTLDIIIANIGPAELTINDITLCENTSTEFSWSALSNSLFSSGDSEILTISFNPTNTGLEEGCIEIHTDNPDQSPKTVNVSGEGVNKVSGGGNGGGGGGKPDGGDSSSLSMTTSLTGEMGGSVDGIAQFGETLTYTTNFSNSNKNPVNGIVVTEIVPGSTVHTGGDFNCGAGSSAGSICTATIDVPGKSKGTNGSYSLSFEVMVDTQFNTIHNAVSATNIDCASTANTCTVDTPADDNDPVNPTLEVLGPSDGGNVPEAGFMVHGTASDAAGMDSVKVFIEDVEHSSTTDFSETGAWNINLSGFPPNSVQPLSVRAYDSNNNVTINPDINVTIEPTDSTPPTLVVLSPADGGTVPAFGFTAHGTASDAGGIDTVIVSIGNNDHPATYNSADDTWTVNLPAYPDGTNLTLGVTATDISANTSAPELVNVQVQLTTGAITGVRHLLNRITYGITPIQLDQINSGTFDMNAYRDNQLALTPSVSSCDDMDPGDPLKPTTPSKYSAGYTLPIDTQDDLAAYAAIKAAFNPCQLQEVLTQFWDNHFHTRWSTVNAKYAVENGGVQDQSLTVSWELEENDFFRTNALGNFRDLVEFNAKSPTMLYYLDSYLNEVTAPNENYARELLELHTVEVGNHTQTDVEEGARAFTGWTVDLATGTYMCDPAKHDFGAISLDLLDGAGTYELSAADSAASCEAAGQWVIDQAIAHPNTANFICKKLTAVLVNDNPPASVVSACASVFQANTASPNQIRLAVEAILTTSRFADADDYLDKVKTPMELASGYLRTFEIPETGKLEEIQDGIRNMSMDLFQFSTPDGYPETAIDWVNPELLLQRFRFISDVAFNPSISNDVYIDPLAFFTGHGKTTDVEIVDYLMNLALANSHTIDEYNEALAVLNSGSTYVSVDDATKRTRLRRLLAVVLSYPGYQYQ